MAILYIVATPIGNLEDITLRALRILKEVDLILCEDTRTTKTLLMKYDIKTPTQSYHSNTTDAKHEALMRELASGKTMALVTDAGTPCISDPGVLLVKKLRELNDPNITIVPIPGASACITALSASGIPSATFTFYGFLPHKKGRETLFKEIIGIKHTAVFYESPHRLTKTLEKLTTLIPKRHMVIGRELTKKFEEIKAGSVHELATYFTKNSGHIRGEFVLILEGIS
ncbi:16S rRNA (cytidine(1402)-2'-O)-methyltransferase [Candidatus Nomurabacteria bacterium]|jgi:16S rRNA (cytidine1402-2'-O)-methyltransferase|nr:MAG: 16S rRNA (cytidine(1402)-2'-O)-methyltransferase [Candidatus Nomurabacteria bacterium]